MFKVLFNFYFSTKMTLFYIKSICDNVHCYSFEFKRRWINTTDGTMYNFFSDKINMYQFHYIFIYWEYKVNEIHKWIRLAL